VHCSGRWKSQGASREQRPGALWRMLEFRLPPLEMTLLAAGVRGSSRRRVEAAHALACIAPVVEAQGRGLHPAPWEQILITLADVTLAGRMP
jgi:hypothetical protein